MAQSCGSDKSKCDAVWSDEQDRIPLKQRLKLLLASNRLSDFSGSNPKNATPKSEIVGKKEEKHSDLQVDFVDIVGEGRVEKLSLQQSFDDVDKVGECGSQGTKVCSGIHFNQTRTPEINIISMKEETGANEVFSYQNSMPFDYYVKVKTECTDYCSTSLPQNCVNGSSVVNVPAVKIKTEFSDDLVEDVDHIVLQDRQKMLLSRKLLESKRLVLEADSTKLSGPVSDDGAQCSFKIGKEDSLSCEKQPIMTGSYDTSEQDKFALCKNPESGLTKVASVESSSGAYMVLALEKQQTEFSNLLNTQERETPSNRDSCSMQTLVPHNNNTVLSLDSSTLVAIKAEPIDNIDIPGRDENFSDVSFGNLVPVKCEADISNESYWDKLDHMLLHERMKMLAPGGIPSVNIHEEFECLDKTVPSALDCRPIPSEHSKPLKVSRPRKRRKTVTDSVDTALEEDAPGLLRVLIENGVLVNEMKLYGEIESNDALDESLVEDSFTELEAVMSKLFSQRPSLLKLAPLNCTKGEKASYCLGCLISLVEQARYLQFRKWPVEWGWCRDLQAFIFVFERHNRIVLERPEYGYATYFFELVDSLPVDWQIKRLVTAMKLTSCSRATLIENKALMIGEDLTEGEARVDGIWLDT